MFYRMGPWCVCSLRLSQLSSLCRLPSAITLSVTKNEQKGFKALPLGPIYGPNCQFLYQARVFSHGKLFQPSLMFVGKARSLPYQAL